MSGGIIQIFDVLRRGAMLGRMRPSGGRRWAGRLWRFFKWAVGWPLAIFGAIGLPDQLWQWENYIGKLAAKAHAVMTDPHVTLLAEKAVEIANFVNHPAVRVVLVIAGVAILIWRWRPFWNMRHRLRFAWRVFLGEETWINREDALKIIMASDWAQLREPTPWLLGGLALGGGISEFQRDKIRFKHFIEMTLESFEQNHPQGVREVENKKQYAESRLRSFMDHALDAEAIEKFGKIPT